MPALVATDIFIQITWVGVVTARHTTEVETESRSTVNLDWDGVVGGEVCLLQAEAGIRGVSLLGGVGDVYERCGMDLGGSLVV